MFVFFNYQVFFPLFCILITAPGCFRKGRSIIYSRFKHVNIQYDSTLDWLSYKTRKEFLALKAALAEQAERNRTGMQAKLNILACIFWKSDLFNLLHAGFE